MRITSTSSHAYPGTRAEVSDIAELGAAQTLVEFADGVTVVACCNVEPNSINLEIPTYRTARGTQVVAQEWVLRRREGKWRAVASGPS